MRDLLSHYCQLDLPESVVFGLGAGLDSLYFDEPAQSPPIMLLGRGVSMEQDLATTLGIDYREEIETNDEAAWQQVRQEIIEGRPTMLAGDIYYLDYRKFKVHFPGHRFVLAGFDDEQQCVFIGDRTEAELQTCSMQAVALSRNSPAGMSSYNLWGKFHSGEVRHSLEQACEASLRITVQRMLGEDTSQQKLIEAQRPEGQGVVASGLAGLSLFRQHMSGWDGREMDTALAGYLVNTIVNFGTGGGLFRNLFADYLNWAHLKRSDLVDAHCVDLAKRTALHWNTIATTATLLREGGQCCGHTNLAAATEAWQNIDSGLANVEATERELFERIAKQVL